MTNKTVEKIQLVSDNLCYGSCPAQDDEIVQRLTIRRDGRIFLTVYNYMNVELYRQWLRCYPAQAGRLLDKIAERFSTGEELYEYQTDVGKWMLQLFYSDGSKDEYSCSLHGGQIGLNDLTKEIRRVVGMPSLFGFIGENDRAVTLMEACKKAIGKEKYIIGIRDVKSGYVIMSSSDESEVPCYSPCIVYKDTGKMDVFFPPDHKEELDAGRNLKVPHQYAIPKMIQ